MIRTVYLNYYVKNKPVVLGYNQHGELVALHVDGADFSENGQMAFEIIEALEDRGVNLQEAISIAFEKAQRAIRPEPKRSLVSQSS